MSINRNMKVLFIVIILLGVLSAVLVLYYQLNFSQTAIQKKIEYQDGYSVVNQKQDISVEFRIAPENLPKKQGDVFNLNQVIYDDNNTKIYLETVALYSPPKNTRDLFIELRFEQKFNMNEGRFVSPYIYNGPDSFGHVMFEPQYYNDNGEELRINDGNGMKVVFFTPDQINELNGGLTLKYNGFNLVEYSKN